ncbi:unnamed protein product [Closterium sp. NIES-54]
MSAQAPNPQALLVISPFSQPAVFAAGTSAGRAALSGFTRLSKGLAVVLLMGYVISLLPSAHTAFALLPGRQVPPAQVGLVLSPSCVHTCWPSPCILPSASCHACKLLAGFPPPPPITTSVILSHSPFIAPIPPIRARRTIPFAWNLVTAGLFERHLFTVSVTPASSQQGLKGIRRASITSAFWVVGRSRERHLFTVRNSRCCQCDANTALSRTR